MLKRIVSLIASLEDPKLSKKLFFFTKMMSKLANFRSEVFRMLLFQPAGNSSVQFFDIKIVKFQISWIAGE